MTGKDLKEARLKLSLTQEEMSMITGISRPSLARLESEKRQPTKTHAATVAALLFLGRHGLLEKFIEQIKQTKLRED